MDLVEREIEEKLENQQKIILEEYSLEMISRIQEKPELGQLSTIKLANEIKSKLGMNLGGALCMSFWLDELQQLCVSTQEGRQRAIHIGRLLKISGKNKALNYALSQIPESRRGELREIWAELTDWKSRK